MVAVIDKSNRKNPEINEEFEKYLTKQRTSTTFNGMEVAEFSSYKRILGFKTV
jgi:hypothetical protein